MAQRKNYLGVYDHSKALTFIEDNVKRNGKAGDNKRVLTDVEEEYLAEVISFCFDRGLPLGDRNVIRLPTTFRSRRCLVKTGKRLTRPTPPT